MNGDENNRRSTEHGRNQYSSSTAWNKSNVLPGYVKVHNNLHTYKSMHYLLRFEQNFIKFNNTNITHEIQPRPSSQNLKKMTGKDQLSYAGSRANRKLNSV